LVFSMEGNSFVRLTRHGSLEEERSLVDKHLRSWSLGP
jgi:hypothetical protein